MKIVVALLALFTIIFFAYMIIRAKTRTTLAKDQVAPHGTSLKDVLQHLEASLKKNEPKTYATLQAPLTEVQIQALEKKYDIQLPAGVKELYQWKNGQHFESSSHSLFGNKTFMTLQDALEVRAALNHEISAGQTEDHFKIKDFWNKNWIPVFENGGGDYLCYDMAGVFSGKPGQIIDYYHDEYYRRIVAASLKSFLHAIILVIEKKYDDEDTSLRESTAQEYPKSIDLQP